MLELVIRPLAIFVAAAVSAIAGAQTQTPFWVNTGPTGGVVQAIATDPTDSGVVYVGVREGGVFRYDSQSDFWTTASSGLADFDVLSLSISPSNPAVLLAGTRGGLYRTTNSGGGWALASGPPNDQMTALAFDPSGSVAYAVSVFGWMGKSTDGGATWQALGGEVSTKRPQAVTVDPSNASRVYVGTIDNGVYKSENGGTSFTPINQGLANLHVATIAVDPTNASLIYAGTDTGGAFRSEDAGANWAAFSTGLSGSDVDAIVVDTEGRAFLGNQSGIFGSIDGGLGWIRLSAVRFINALTLGPGTPQPLYVGFGQLPLSEGGLLVSIDHRIFVLPSEVGFNGISISALAVDPNDPQRVLTAGATIGSASENGGASWESGFAIALGSALAFDPTEAGVVYEGAPAGVYRSDTGGSLWSVASGNLPAGPVTRALAFAPNPAGRLLAGIATGVSFTDDDGLNWTASDLTETVYGLSASSSSVWAGTTTGVFRSNDGGATWTRVGNATASPVYSVLESTVTPRIFAASAQGLLSIPSGGGNWQPVGGGLPVFDTRSVIEDPARGAIYAGGIGGVFESLDDGATWHPAATGLTNPQIQAMALLPSGTLLAGARGGSVFRRVVAGSSDRQPVERTEPRGTPIDLPPRP